MRPLRLDYRARDHRVAGIALLIGAVAVVGYLAHDYVGLNAELENLEGRRARLKHEARIGARGAAETERETTARLKPELKRAAEVVANLARPWDALFQSVEAASSGEVALLAIEPDVEGRTVTLTAEARDHVAMLEYVKRLNREPVFSRAHVVSHQIEEQDPQRPVRFTVLAGWVERVPRKEAP